MNRLMIIGNGFDLAQGMKTDYHSFILHYIKSCFQHALTRQAYKDVLGEVEGYRHVHGPDINNFTSIEEFEYFLRSDGFNFSFLGEDNDNWNDAPRQRFVWSIQNDFFSRLITKCSHLRWVDIENEYYRELKRIMFIEDADEKEKALKELNNGLSFLKNKLREYLKSLPKPDSIEEYFHIFSLKMALNDSDDPEFPQQTLILNFNYTDTPDMYRVASTFNSTNTVTTIPIHGRLSDGTSSMIFGFGDELDEDYKK